MTTGEPAARSFGTGAHQSRRFSSAITAGGLASSGIPCQRGKRMRSLPPVLLVVWSLVAAAVVSAQSAPATARARPRCQLHGPERRSLHATSTPTLVAPGSRTIPFRRINRAGACTPSCRIRTGGCSATSWKARPFPLRTGRPRRGRLATTMPPAWMREPWIGPDSRP